MENSTIGIICGVLFFILISSCSEFNYTEQNERVFEYDVSSGLAVSQNNNPLLSYGMHMCFGYDCRYFVVDSEINDYHKTSKISDESPYDESLSWDSKEGSTMLSNFTILGKVTDPWKFYAHYGKSEVSVYTADDIQDKRIYEALVQAAQFADARMGELTEKVDAEKIRKDPSYYSAQLTKDTAIYAEQFGFTVTEIIFSSRFEFPDKDKDGKSVIDSVREQLGAKHTQIEEVKLNLETALAKQTNDLAAARIEAYKITKEGEREADRILTETTTLANRLATSIKQVGIDNTLALEMVKLQGELTKNNVISDVYLTEESIFAQPFYK